MRSVFGTELFCYGKENRSAKRFLNKIVVLWERKEKWISFCEENCFLIGRKERWKSFSEQNCSLMGKKREVVIVFGTKLFSYGKENGSANRF